MLSDVRFERALTLMNILIDCATGGAGDDFTYQKLRREFMEDPNTRLLLPQYVRTCRDQSSFWPIAKSMSPNWEGRRVQLRQDFEPLLAKLEEFGAPVDTLTSEILEKFSAQGVHAAWEKALRRREHDPEGAITMARTLLETVLKHILHDACVRFEDSDDLPKLYKLAAERLNLAPSQHTETAFKRVLGGCTSVVEGLGTIRNRIGDAHGSAPQPAPVRPTARHAQLVVNLAGAMATFLLETWAVRNAG